MQDLKEAVRLCPSNPPALLTLGQLLLCLNKTSDAQSAFQAGLNASSAATDLSVLQRLNHSLRAMQTGNRDSIALASRGGHPFGATSPPPSANESPSSGQSIAAEPAPSSSPSPSTSNDATVGNTTCKVTLHIPQHNSEIRSTI
jgi:hypothetical protein